MFPAILVGIGLGVVLGLVLIAAYRPARYET